MPFRPPRGNPRGKKSKRCSERGPSKRGHCLVQSKPGRSVWCKRCGLSESARAPPFSRRELHKELAWTEDLSMNAEGASPVHIDSKWWKAPRSSSSRHPSRDGVASAVYKSPKGMGCRGSKAARSLPTSKSISKELEITQPTCRAGTPASHRIPRW
jgi:hypothetical protein